MDDLLDWVLAFVHRDSMKKSVTWTELI